MVARAQGIGLGVEEGEDALALVVVQVGPQHRHAPRRRAAPTATNFQKRTPAMNRSAVPLTRSVTAVPRSGWTRTRPQGIRISSSAGTSTHRPPEVVEIGGVEIAGQRHHQRHLHQLGGLELHEAEIEPALGALVDLAQHVDGDQHGQHDARSRGRTGETRSAGRSGPSRASPGSPPPAARRGAMPRARASRRRPSRAWRSRRHRSPAAGRPAASSAPRSFSPRVSSAAAAAAGRCRSRRVRPPRAARPPGSSSSALRMMSRAIGEAALEPLMPCSTTTATA